MWDRRNNKISAGDYLRDVRFGWSSFVLVTAVVYNTRIEVRATNTKSDGGWTPAYSRSLTGTYDYETVPAGSVPPGARERLS